MLLAHNANLRAQAKVSLVFRNNVIIISHHDFVDCHIILNLYLLSQDQYTPLHLASWKGHKEIVSVLLAHNANTEVQNKVSGFGFSD